jgi:hypothetical protein
MAFKPYKIDRVDAVHDGDTITVHLDLGLDECHTARVRLLNVFAAEANAPGGAAARAEVVAWFTAHRSPFTLYTYLSKLGNERNTLGRWVGDVHDADDASLCTSMGLWLLEHPESGGGIGA